MRNGERAGRRARRRRESCRAVGDGRHRGGTARRIWRLEPVRVIATRPANVAAEPKKAETLDLQRLATGVQPIT